MRDADAASDAEAIARASRIGSAGADRVRWRPPAMPTPPARRSLATWAHAVLGVGLLLFLVVHLVQVWPLIEDPRAFVIGAAERAQSGGTRRAAIVVMVLVALHAVLALVALRKRSEQAPASARGLDLVQITAGLLTAAFVVYHLLQTRVLEQGPHLGAWDGYGALLAALSQPLHLGAYVVGVTAVCFHVAFGGARFASRSAAGSRRMRLLFGSLGLFLWALWLQPLARLATGAALF
jgi:hypothetical protein